MDYHYDLIVIGSGTGGYVAAIRAAQLGLKTAVVERQPVLGGTCLNWGCIPTKVLLEHAHALDVVRRAGEWGIDVGATDFVPAIDMSRVHQRKDRIVASLTKGVEYLFRKNKITWIRGSARLAGNGRVTVSGADACTLTSREIVVATGSTPRALANTAFDAEHVISSDDAIRLRDIPKSMAIVGSGAVGVEFASIFQRFGTEITLVELLPRIVPNEDDAVSAELHKSFKKRGISVMTSSKVESAMVTSDGVRVEVAGENGATTRTVVDKLLVAIGRGPMTDGLGAEEVGLALERGYIRVDDQFRTNVAGISAIGDVIAIGAGAHAQLAHLSSAEGVVAAERIAGRSPRAINYDHVPACTYCDPEIGSVGLTEAEARARGYNVRIGTFPLGVLGRAKIAGDIEGFVKIVGETRYDQVLGVHIIGARATELIAEATVALQLESTVEELVRTIHAHPTMSEGVGEAAHAVHGAAIHV